MTATASEEGVRWLAAGLTVLSGALWRTYTHPASAVPEAADGEHSRRAHERERVSRVTAIVLAPNVATDEGAPVLSYSPVEQAAAWVGSALLQLGDADLTERVQMDVAEEITAVEGAAFGKLAGRAAQAAALSRPEASPTQIAEAHATFSRAPLGGVSLFRDFEPTAAAVAAAHWLHAAARVAGKLCGEDDLASVVLVADGIEELAVTTPAVVLGRMESGISARQVVVDLVAEAMVAADGYVAAPLELVARIGEAISQAANDACDEAGEERLRLELLSEVRASLLNPMRPAQDLLEDLVAGIYECWLLYSDYSDGEHAHDEYDDYDDISDIFRDRFEQELRDAALASPPG